MEWSRTELLEKSRRVGLFMLLLFGGFLFNTLAVGHPLFSLGDYLAGFSGQHSF